MIHDSRCFLITIFKCITQHIQRIANAFQKTNIFFRCTMRCRKRKNRRFTLRTERALEFYWKALEGPKLNIRKGRRKASKCWSNCWSLYKKSRYLSTYLAYGANGNKIAKFELFLCFNFIVMVIVHHI